MRNNETLNQDHRIGVAPSLSTGPKITRYLALFLSSAMAVLAGGCAKSCDKTGTYDCLENDDRAKATLKHVRKDVKDCRTAMRSVDTATGDTLYKDRTHAEDTCVEAGETATQAEGYIRTSLAKAKKDNDRSRIEACKLASTWITGRAQAIEADHGELERK